MLVRRPRKGKGWEKSFIPVNEEVFKNTKNVLFNTSASNHGKTAKPIPMDLLRLAMDVEGKILCRLEKKVNKPKDFHI